jgi:hypothetical protein
MLVSLRVHPARLAAAKPAALEGVVVLMRSSVVVE